MADNASVVKDWAGTAGPGHGLGMLVAGIDPLDPLSKPRAYTELTEKERAELRESGSDWHLAGNLGGGVLGAGIGIGSQMASGGSDYLGAGAKGWALGSLAGSLALPAAHSWWKTRQALNDPNYEILKKAGVAPLARIGENAPVPRGDSMPATIVANPFGTSDVKTPQAHDYENGHLYAEHLGLQGISSADDHNWLSWGGHSAAWKKGFSDALQSLGLSRYASKLDAATKVSAMLDTFPYEILGAVHDEEQEKDAFLPLLAAPLAAGGLYSMGRDSVTHKPGVTSAEQDQVRDETGSALGHGAKDTASTLIDDAAIGGVTGAGISAFDNYGVVPHAWNAANDAVMSGVHAVGRGWAPPGGVPTPHGGMDEAQRIQGTRAQGAQRVSDYLTSRKGYKFDFDPATQHGVGSRVMRGGLAGMGFGLAAGIPHALANSYMAGQNEAEHALDNIRYKGAELVFVDDEKTAGYTVIDEMSELPDDEGLWATELFGEKIAAFYLNPVGHGSDEVMKHYPEMSAVDADNARPGVVKTLAGNAEALGAGAIGAGAGAGLGMVAGPALGRAISMIPGAEGIGDAVGSSNLTPLAGALAGGVAAHQMAGHNFGERHTQRNVM